MQYSCRVGDKLQGQRSMSERSISTQTSEHQQVVYHVVHVNFDEVHYACYTIKLVHSCNVFRTLLLCLSLSPEAVL